MVRGHGEQQLVNFGWKVGAITRRRNQPAFGINAHWEDNTAASLRAIINIADDFSARQAAVDREMVPQPLGERLPRVSPRNFDCSTPAGIAQTHKSEVKVQ